MHTAKKVLVYLPLSGFTFVEACSKRSRIFVVDQA